MEFSVLGRPVGVTWAHMALFTGVFIAISIAVMLISAAAAFVLEGGITPESFIAGTAATVSLLALVSGPVEAYLLLKAGKMAKMKTDVAFCRSVSAASFLLVAALYLVFFALVLIGNDFFSDIYPLFGIPMTAGQFLSLGAGTFVTYFWLLAVLEYKAGRATRTAMNALLFAIGLFVLERIFEFVLDYSAGTAAPLAFGASMAFSFVRFFVFAFAVLYVAGGKKLDMAAAWLFAAMYVGSAVLFDVNNVLAGSMAVAEAALEIAHPVFALALLYVLCRSKGVGL